VAHLQEAQGIEILPDVINNFRPCDEDIPSGLIHDEVKIPLPIPRLLVHKTLSSGQLMKARGKKLDFANSEGELAHLRSRRQTGNTDDVTSSEDAVR